MAYHERFYLLPAMWTLQDPQGCSVAKATTTPRYSGWDDLGQSSGPYLFGSPDLSQPSTLNLTGMAHHLGDPVLYGNASGVLPVYLILYGSRWTTQNLIQWQTFVSGTKCLYTQC